MIFAGPYLSSPDCHFNMNIVDSIGHENDLVIDVIKDEDYLEKIKIYLKNKTIENELVIYNPHEKEDFVIQLKKTIPDLKIFMYCSDDEWRCFNYDRYLALYVDFFSITEKKHIPLYRKWGFINVIHTNWACNPKIFHPISIEKKYDVTFIGAAYGKRIEYVKEAIKNNIKIKVYGKGWDRFSDIKPYWGGFLSSKDMTKVINQSKINLNFMWSSQGGYQVKGRNFELSGCGAFQLCNYTKELLSYFQPGVNIETFNDKKEFIDKIIFYLNHNHIREVVAANAFTHTIKYNTWDIKFKEIFYFGVNKKPISTLPIFKILINANDGVKHKVTLKDKRLEIYFRDTQKHYDGIINLSHDSTINNHTIFMMAFALYADDSDVVFTNFFINNIWIRFKDKKFLKTKYFMRLLPSEVTMFKDKNNMNKNITHFKQYSFIEYPTLKVDQLFSLKKIFFRLFFSSYHRQKYFKSYKKEKNYLGMIGIAFEVIARRLYP